jgi:hypothetical protein
MRILIVEEKFVAPPAHEWLLAALVFMALRERWIEAYREGPL